MLMCWTNGIYKLIPGDARYEYLPKVVTTPVYIEAMNLNI